MSRVKRFSVSLEKGLVEIFDRWVKRENFPSRSHAVAELIRRYISETEWNKGKRGVGVILFVYNHDRRGIASQLIEIQHEHHSVILSTQHIHLSRHRCLEVLAVKGSPNKIRELYRALKGTKGVERISIEIV